MAMTPKLVYYGNAGVPESRQWVINCGPSCRYELGALLIASAVGTGLGVGADALTRQDPKVGTMSTQTPFQQRLQKLMMADLLKVPGSQLVNADDFGKLIKTGYFDETSLWPELGGYEDQRVAGLTGTQKDILGSVGGFTDRINAGGSSIGQGAKDIFASRGMALPEMAEPIESHPELVGTTGIDTPRPGDRQPITPEEVGEDGPETITAKEDSMVIPNWWTPKKSWDEKKGRGPWEIEWTEKGPQVVSTGGTGWMKAMRDLASESWAKKLAERQGSPVTEGNQVGADPNELLDETNLPGMATGGFLPAGQSVVAGEQGPEQVIPFGQGNINTAMQRALSGQASTNINPEATEALIQRSIADPARQNFAENTLQQIKGSYAGPGYWGSARAKAEMKGAENVENQILSQGAQYRYADEQARRTLAESAANRAAGSIPTALNVQNNPFVQGQMQANIEQTQFGTEAGKALLPAQIKQALANVGMTEVQMDRATGLIEQDMATTGQISATTAGILTNIGVTEAQIEQIRANTARTDMALYGDVIDQQQQQQQLIRQQLDNFTRQMTLAGLEQTQNQAQINADIAEHNETNQWALARWNEFLNMINQSLQSAVVTPGVQGIGGSIAGAVTPAVYQGLTED